MYFHFHQFFTPNKEQYLKEKLKTNYRFLEGENLLPETNFISEQYGHISKHSSYEGIPLATAEEFFKVDKKQRFIIDAAMRCAQEEVASVAPLIKGETVSKDFLPT